MARDRASRPEARPLRLFVAFDVPREVRERMAATVADVRDRVPEARWSPPENWHVTMKFLGGVWPRLRGRVEEAVRDAAGGAERVTSRLTEMGAFPSPRRARVLWVGLEDPGERFRKLAARLDELLEPDFEPEVRPYTPHLTVARLRDQAAIPEAVMAADVTSEPFGVTELVLYRSYLARPSARYEALARFPFRG
jgi:RNA 2',3'-cyclic 3'-phosphodiesterase